MSLARRTILDQAEMAKCRAARRADAALAEAQTRIEQLEMQAEELRARARA